MMEVMEVRNNIKRISGVYAKLVKKTQDSLKRVCFQQIPFYLKATKSKTMPILKRIAEFFELLWLQFKVQTRNFSDFTQSVIHYYSNGLFAKLDIALILTYLFKNPYTISQRFLKARGERDIYAYGETPLTTLDFIAKECRITSKDTVFELGCGRGRTSFWLYSFIKCSVVGVDFVGDFIKRAQHISKSYELKGIEFRNENMIDTDFKGATIIYLYGTCLDDDFIRKLAQKFVLLPAGTKIITVSYPLTDYANKEDFEVMKCFPAQFTWGSADVYLNYRK
jgi:hypothetical protein